MNYTRKIWESDNFSLALHEPSFVEVKVLDNSYADTRVLIWEKPSSSSPLSLFDKVVNFLNVSVEGL